MSWWSMTDFKISPNTFWGENGTKVDSFGKKFECFKKVVEVLKKFGRSWKQVVTQLGEKLWGKIKEKNNCFLFVENEGKQVQKYLNQLQK